MHCTGLYDRARATLPGFSAKYVMPNELGLVNDFVQRLRLRQLRLKIDLRGKPATKSGAAENQLEMNYRLMEALDRLSLLFCLNSFEGATIERRTRGHRAQANGLGGLRGRSQRCLP